MIFSLVVQLYTVHVAFLPASGKVWQEALQHIEKPSMYAECLCHCLKANIAQIKPGFHRHGQTEPAFSFNCILQGPKQATAMTINHSQITLSVSPYNYFNCICIQDAFLN